MTKILDLTNKYIQALTNVEAAWAAYNDAVELFYDGKTERQSISTALIAAHDAEAAKTAAYKALNAAKRQALDNEQECTCRENSGILCPLCRATARSIYGMEIG